MKAFIITGSSSGLGKAICELLLEDDNNCVLGISRTKKINHTNYTHISLDLNDIADIEGLEFPNWTEAEQISLIHNAGWIGPIQKMGKQELGAIAASYIINLVAPAVLSNHFIAKYSNTKAQKVILSISSGAAHTPIAGWNTYCSSKAGLDMLSKCIDEEHKDIINLSIAPGKVDTPMQNDIRFADENEFPRLKEFQEYHNKKELSDPKEIALKYKKVLYNPAEHLHINRISEV